MNVGLHLDAKTDRAMRAFVAERGLLAGMTRAAEIAALPVVQWKGRPLRTYRCLGGHDVNASDALGWSLIDLARFRCPYHMHVDPHQDAAERGGHAPAA